MKTKGMFWHVHHDKLVEYCHNYKERADYIRNKKPKNEIGIRLRLFKPVRGKLPVKFILALEAYDKALESREKAWEPCEKAWAGEACEKAGETCEKAWEALEAHEKAWEACEEAWESHEKAWEACKDKIEALHKKECPNCSWDGTRIRFE
jgi:hypothetical protein